MKNYEFPIALVCCFVCLISSGVGAYVGVGLSRKESAASVPANVCRCSPTLPEPVIQLLPSTEEDWTVVVMDGTAVGSVKEMKLEGIPKWYAAVSHRGNERLSNFNFTTKQEAIDDIVRFQRMK